MSFSVQVTPDMVPLDPGATTPISVVVVNKGAEADRFEMEIEGIDPEWKAVPVAVFGVDPGETHTEKIFLKPPRASESLAGNYPFVVRIRSLVSGEQRTVQGVAQVKPYHHLSMEIDPKKGFVSPMRRQNAFDVTLVNLGNTEHTLQLLANDPEDACAYEFDSEQVTIGPGQQRDVELVANPAKSPIFSSGRLIGFSVTGRSIDSPSIVASAQAQLEQRPLLTPTSLAAFLLLAILFAAWFLMMPKPPALGLTVDPMEAVQGQQVVVAWNSENAKRIRITAGEAIIYDGTEPRGQKEITLSTVGVVTIHAEAVNGDQKKNETRSVTVTAPPTIPKPKILSLSASPTRVKIGLPFVMKFSLSPNVTEAILGPTGERIDPALDQQEITPVRTGTIRYTLVAKNANGDTDKKSFDVEVYEESDAQILDFHASPTSVRLDEGGKVTMSWQVTPGAERVEIKAGGNAPIAVPLTGSQEFTITAKTLFTLTAIDAKNRRTSRSVPVYVQIPPPPTPPTTGDTDGSTATTAGDTGSTATTGSTTGTTTTGTTGATSTTTGGGR